MIRKTIVALGLLSAVAFGNENPYSVRLGWGIADKNDLGQILSGEGEFSGAKTHVLGIDGGYLLARSVYDLPIDIYLKGSIYRFLENHHQDSFWEATLYVKAYYNIDVWDNRLRIGGAEGISLAEQIPITEVIDAREKGSNTSKFLNYLDISADIDIGRLLRVPDWKDTYIGYALKHRSGVFGLINGVNHGGSNYDMIYIEKNF
ncbi:MAG: hypothetical protein AB7U44_08260 [Sulfuricurvum sp.]|uniref:hypothetical protein n=1 Tax=Sulfuricurvum sp. TaxID=2025608 RepID=UPI003D0AC671